MFNFLSNNDKKNKFFNESKVACLFSFNFNTVTVEFLRDFIKELYELIGIDFSQHLIHGQNPMNADIKYSAPLTGQFKNSQTEDEFSFGQPYHHLSPPDQIWLKIDESKIDLLINSVFLNSVFAQANFNTLFMFNYGYFDLHNTVDYKSYKQFNIPIKPLYVKEVFTGIKEIDIKKNAGYAEVIKNSWFIASWKMWLRNDFIKTITNKSLANFSNSIDKYQNSFVTYLQLYQNQDEPHFDKNIKVQFQFKEWLELDKIIQNDINKF